MSPIMVIQTHLNSPYNCPISPQYNYSLFTPPLPTAQTTSGITYMTTALQVKNPTGSSLGTLTALLITTRIALVTKPTPTPNLGRS